MPYMKPLTLGLSYMDTESTGWTLRVYLGTEEDQYRNLGAEELVDILEAVVRHWVRLAAEEAL